MPWFLPINSAINAHCSISRQYMTVDFEFNDPQLQGKTILHTLNSIGSTAKKDSALLSISGNLLSGRSVDSTLQFPNLYFICCCSCLPILIVHILSIKHKIEHSMVKRVPIYIIPLNSACFPKLRSQ